LLNPLVFVAPLNLIIEDIGAKEVGIIIIICTIIIIFWINIILKITPAVLSILISFKDFVYFIFKKKLSSVR